MIDLSRISIPSADVVPEPTAEDLAIVNAWPRLDMSGDKVLWGLARRCRELEIDAGNYRGKCAVCNASNMEMLTDTFCASCRIAELEAEVERLRTPKMVRRSATGTTGESI